MRLFDSNILIYSTQPDYAWVTTLWRSGGYVSEVTWVEVLGFERIILFYKELLEAARLKLTPLAVSRTVINEAIRLRQQRKMGLGDALIGATAVLYDLPLVTRNTKDFVGIAGLEVITPFPPTS